MHPRACLVRAWVALLLSCFVPCSSPFTITSSWPYRTPYSQPGWSGRRSTNITGDLQYAHMPMMHTLLNGSLALAWQGSVLPFEGSSKQALYWTTSDDDGITWRPHSLLRAPLASMPLWGPVFHTNATTLFLFYAESNPLCRWGGETGEGAWSPGGDIRMATSRDNGITWATDTVVYSFQDLQPIPKVVGNQLVVTTSGRWVLPMWYERGGECRDDKGLHGVPGMLLSDDQGATWTDVRIPLGKAATAAKTWLIEPTVVEVCKPQGCDGKDGGRLLRVYLRTSTGSLYESMSSDDGRTWAEPTPMTLRNNNSKVNAITLPDGEILLAFNNVSVSAFRTPLSLALSVDDGTTWIADGVLEGNPAGSYAYPALHALVRNTTNRVVVAYQVQYPPGVFPDVARAEDGAVSGSVRNLLWDEGGHDAVDSAWPQQQHHGDERVLQEMHLRAWGLTCWGIKVLVLTDVF